jgi:hypothetical protein
MKSDPPTPQIIVRVLPAAAPEARPPVETALPVEALPPVETALPPVETALPPDRAADWQTSVQQIYDRKTAERRTIGEGDPARYREVAATLSLGQAAADLLVDLADDGLIDDSTAIAPADWRPLSLPSPRGSNADWREIAGTTFLEHTIVKGDASTQRLDCVFAKVTWEVLNQFGLEAAYVLLLLTTRLMQSKDPWNEIVELNTQDLLQLNIWERDLEIPQGRRLRMAGNWFELVCNLSLLINQVNPGRSRFRALRIPLWVIEEMEYGGPLTAAVGGPQPEVAQDLTIRAGLGLWTEQFVATRDREKKASLLQFGYQAATVLQIDPQRRAMTAKLAILVMLLDRLHPDDPQSFAIGALLEVLESQAIRMEMRRRKDRLQAAYSRWNTSLHTLQRLGWTIGFDEAIYPAHFQPAWHNPAATGAHLQTEIDQWLDQWLRCQVRITPPPYVRVEPDPRDLPLVERFSGRNLSQALALKGMAQSKLADYLQLDRSMVTYWIKGARLIQPRHREQICGILSAELTQVLAEEDALAYQ